MNYWLLKSEPDTFSIDDLAKRPGQTEPWDGVRNYQARNFLKSMQVHDLGFFYHSSCETPGIFGEVEIVKAAYPDPSQFNSKSKYFDPNSSEDNPRWFMVEVHFREKYAKPIFLQNIRANTELKDLHLTKRGNRLSVMPISQENWQLIQAMR